MDTMQGTNRTIYHTIDDDYIITYYSDTGDELIHQQDKWTKAVVLDRIISLAIYRNLDCTKAADFDTELRIDMAYLADMIYPAESWEPVTTVCVKRKQYKERLIEALWQVYEDDKALRSITGRNLFRRIAQPSKYKVDIELNPYMLHNILATTDKRPIYASVSLYKPPTLSRDNNVSVNKRLIRYMMDHKTEDTLDLLIPLEDFLSIVPGIKDTRETRDGTRKVRRHTYINWIKKCVKPMIDGCGIYKLVAATQYELWFKSSDEQLAVENRIKREGSIG